MMGAGAAAERAWPPLLPFPAISDVALPALVHVIACALGVLFGLGLGWPLCLLDREGQRNLQFQVPREKYSEG